VYDVLGVAGGHLVPAVWSSDCLLRVQRTHEEVLSLSRADLNQTRPSSHRYVVERAQTTFLVDEPVIWWLIHPRELVQIIVMSVSVCLYVRSHNSKTKRLIFAKFSIHVAYGHGSVLLWWRCDMLRTSGFVDDIAFSWAKINHDVIFR